MSVEDTGQDMLLSSECESEAAFEFVSVRLQNRCDGEFMVLSETEGQRGLNFRIMFLFMSLLAQQ